MILADIVTMGGLVAILSGLAWLEMRSRTGPRHAYGRTPRRSACGNCKLDCPLWGVLAQRGWRMYLAANWPLAGNRHVLAFPGYQLAICCKRIGYGPAWGLLGERIRRHRHASDLPEGWEVVELDRATISKSPHRAADTVEERLLARMTRSRPLL